MGAVVTMLQARPFIAVCHYSHMTTGHSSYILTLNHQKTGDQCQCQEGGDCPLMEAGMLNDYNSNSRAAEDIVDIFILHTRNV